MENAKVLTHTSMIRSALYEAITQTLEDLKTRLGDLERALDEAAILDIERGFFTVAIYDYWDASGGANEVRSCSVTKRGLAAAIEACENEYRRRNGGHDPRTDGVLQYTVIAELDHGSFSLPLETWAELTSQPLESLQKAKR